MTDNIKLPPLPEGNVAHLIAAQAAEIERLQRRVAELEKALRDMAALANPSAIALRKGQAVRVVTK